MNLRCIDSANIGFDNAAEISEKFHDIFFATESISNDAVEETFDVMLQYDAIDLGWGC